VNDDQLTEIIDAYRGMFPHITPVIPDFDALEADGGDAYTAIRETAKILTTTDSAIPLRYRDAYATNPDLLDWISELTSKLVTGRMSRVPLLNTGPSLLILGPTGTGKTHQGYGALRHLSVMGVSCASVASSAADVYAKLRPRHGIDSEAEFERYANARLLFLDDLGAAKTSEWVEEVNYRLINHRYEKGFATIFTSNVPPKELGERLGERVASRLTEMARPIVLKGKDRRLRVVGGES
jgi:DNA replication protein DnaC